MAEKIGYFIVSQKDRGEEDYLEIYRLNDYPEVKIPVNGQEATLKSEVTVGKRIGKMPINGKKPTLENLPDLINQAISSSGSKESWSEAYQICGGKPVTSDDTFTVSNPKYKQN